MFPAVAGIINGKQKNIVVKHIQIIVHQLAMLPRIPKRRDLEGLYLGRKQELPL